MFLCKRIGEQTLFLCKRIEQTFIQQVVEKDICVIALSVTQLSVSFSVRKIRNHI